jgi:hypothetical protein
MEIRVLFSEDPAFVLRRADEFLSSKAVVHNLILSILHPRVAQPDPGRYWIALYGEKTVVGVVVQSPLEYPATLTPMEPGVDTHTLSCRVVGYLDTMPATKIVSRWRVNQGSLQGEPAVLS